MNSRPLRVITDDEFRTFEADGFVRLRGMFDDDWIERLRRATEVMLDRPGPAGADFNEGGQSGRMAFDKDMWLYNDDFRTFIFESPAAELAATILNSPFVNPVINVLLCKEPHTPTVTSFHQDVTGNAVEGPALGMRVSLDTETPESGAMQWVRGSHKWGRRFEPVGSNDVYEHEVYAGRAPDTDRPDGLEEMPDIDAIVDPADILSFETEPGDVIMHDVLNIHSSPGNNSDRRRRALGPRFAGEQATYAVRQTKLNIRPLVDPELNHGDHFPPEPDHHVFPQVWPNAA